MLGKTVGDIRGQVVGTRVLGDIGTGPRMETTDHGIGTLYGVQVTQTVTYVGTLRPNGTIAGEATGVVMSEKGDGGTFRGQGVGTFVRPGVTQWRGSLCYETAGTDLAGLNGIAVLFEYTVDESGKTEGHLYEWK
jgi:hypothetical protein